MLSMRVAGRAVSALVLFLTGACADVTAPVASAVPQSPRSLLVSGSYTDVMTGKLFISCGVAAGTVSCWGPDAFKVTPPADLTGAVRVGAGRSNACALLDDATVRCWGDANSGLNTVPGGLSGVTQVSVGSEHVCALKSDGTVVCWGRNDAGQTAVPAGLTGATNVSAGWDHSCAVKSDGTVVCWGQNQDRQLDVPGGLTSAVQVSAGGVHTCAVKSDGTVLCWGAGRYNPARDGYDLLAVPQDLPTVAQVAAGYEEVCVRSTAGTARCWGRNREPGLHEFMALQTGLSGISVGEGSACVAKTDGSFACYGYLQGTIPQPGSVRVNPTATFTATPVTVTAGSSFTLSLTDAAVAGGTSTFTYAFDCGAGTFETPSTTSSVTCPTTTAGTLTVRGKVIDQEGDSTVYSTSVTVSARVNPTATFTATPVTVTAGSSFTLSLTDAAVAGGTSTFTYAFDCGGGTFGTPSTTSSVTCPTTTAGTLTVRGRVIDQEGDFTDYSGTITVSAPVVATPLVQLRALRDAVNATTLDRKVRQGLLYALDEAIKAMSKAQPGGGCQSPGKQHGNGCKSSGKPWGRGQSDACKYLASFQQQVSAQRGRRIPASIADAWLSTVTTIRSGEGCGR